MGSNKGSKKWFFQKTVYSLKKSNSFFVISIKYCLGFLTIDNLLEEPKKLFLTNHSVFALII